MKVLILVVATWVLAGCEARGLDPDTKAMVILSADISPKHPTWNFTVPACGWYGVYCDGKANATTGRVTSINWDNMGLNGTPCLDSLPQDLSWLDLNSNHFSGTPDLTSLNQDLNYLNLYNNSFSGTPNLTSLNHGLNTLLLGYNEFSGNGQIAPNATWCVDTPPAFWQGMCGSRSGLFDCAQGLWHC